MRSWIVKIVIIAAVAAGAFVLWRHLAQAQAVPVSYTTVPVVRGDLAETIAATGTVEPEEVVDVGAQVAGQVMGASVNQVNTVPRAASPVTEPASSLPLV